MSAQYATGPITQDSIISTKLARSAIPFASISFSEDPPGVLLDASNTHQDGVVILPDLKATSHGMK